MKCSVELPIEYLEYSDRFDYDFVIASTYVTHPAYRQWYLDRKDTERFRQHSILDNGAFETGESLPDEQYAEIIRELCPSIVVIPDVAFNPAASFKRTLDFMHHIRSADEYYVRLPATCKYMAVIQANGDLNTAIMMGHAFRESGLVDYIGVPYISKLDRYSLISEHFANDKVHILGCPTLPEAMTLGTLPNVVSIDSSLPVKVTRAQKLLNRELRSHFTATPDTTGLDGALLQRNLDIFVQTCHNDAVIVGR